MSLQEVILTDILSQETEVKIPSVEKIVEEALPDQFNNNEKTDPDIDTPKKTPEESADAIIDMLNLLNKGVFIPLITWKAKKKYPKDFVQKCELALIKEMEGKELTDTDKKVISNYHLLAKKMDKIKSTVPFTDEEKEELKPATIGLVKQFGWEISGAVWFGVRVTEMFSKRIIDVFID